jgi:hypothetical protein
MGAILSPRVDALSKLQPNLQLQAKGKPVAKAEGLTVDEALELTAWLKESGYDSIEVIHEADHCSVLWSK